MYLKEVDGSDAPLTFPLRDQRLPPGLHVQAQAFHHAVDAVVQGQAARLRQDGLAADGTLVLLLTPLLDAVAAEAVSTVQDDCLHAENTHLWVRPLPSQEARASVRSCLNEELRANDALELVLQNFSHLCHHLFLLGTGLFFFLLKKLQQYKKKTNSKTEEEAEQRQPPRRLPGYLCYFKFFIFG